MKISDFELKKKYSFAGCRNWSFKMVWNQNWFCLLEA